MGAVVPAAPAAGSITRQGFSEQSIEQAAETAGAALAARARSMTEARFIVAMRHPRDLDTVRAKLLRACERPGFAGSATDKTWGAAWYRKPVGEGVEGFSIRFAEEAVRALGNLDITATTVYDDSQKRIVAVVVTDLESNNAYEATIVLEKTVERSRVPRGEEAIRTRVNSRGQAVYVLAATDDDVNSKQNNLTSKAVRTLVLRVLPGDIQAECRTRILAIRQGDAATDPDKVRRQVADAFASLNVLPAGLKELLGHDLGTCTPAELADLRELYAAIRDGHTTWAAALEDALAERGEEAAPAAPPKTGLDAATERLKATAPTPPPAAPPSRPAHVHPADVLERLREKPAGTPVECPECGELLMREREPGEDDGLANVPVPPPPPPKPPGLEPAVPPTEENPFLRGAAKARERAAQERAKSGPAQATLDPGPTE